MKISKELYDRSVYTAWNNRYPEEMKATVEMAEKIFTRLNGGTPDFELHFIAENNLSDEAESRNFGMMVRTQYAPEFPNAATIVLREERVRPIDIVRRAR